MKDKQFQVGEARSMPVCLALLAAGGCRSRDRLSLMYFHRHCDPANRGMPIVVADES